MTPSRQTEDMRDEILQFVHKSEESITEAGRKWSEAALDFVPGDGASIRKVVDEAFDMTERILKNQRELANSLLDSFFGHSPAARKPAAKRTTKRTTAA